MATPETDTPPAPARNTFRSLIILDFPDGTRKVFHADTPGSITNGRLIVFRTDMGWDGSADHPLHPCPGMRLYVEGTCEPVTWSGRKIPAAPWVIYCVPAPLP